MKARLVELLACPRCRGPLAPVDHGTRLICAACAVAFPVVDGVPILVPGAAQSCPAA